MTKSGRHADKGRNACVTAQRVFVTPVRRNTAKYTPRGTYQKGPPGQKYHILAPEERLECFQEYSKWIKEGRKKGKSPIPSLKRKYRACQNPSFFSRMMKRLLETGTISPSQSPGRDCVYDKDQIAPLIKQCVDDAREQQKVADAPSIRRFLLNEGISPCPSEHWILDHKKERGVMTIKIKFKPQLKFVMMEDRQETAEIIIDFNNDPKYLVGSGDESNFGAEGKVDQDRCFEVYPEDEESVPDTIRFAPRDWETPTQKTKVMFFAATCPLGRLVLKELNVTGHMNKKGKQAKGVDSAFLIKSGVFCEVYRALKRLCKPDQTPFLIIDKATVHTSKVMREHLDSIFTSDGWMFQAAKMPDSNDGDVGLFPFMKREVAKLGGATTRAEIATCVKKAWTLVTPKVCKNIRARVMRNLKWVAENGGKNYYDESMTKAEFGL